MKKILSDKTLILLLLMIVSALQLHAQKGDVQVNQSKEVDALLELKKDLNKRKTNYKIQIYNGNRAGAENARSRFLSSYSGWSTSIQYETPNYKIWVGNFRTRLEADRALLRVKRKFPNAFIFRPKKN